MSFVREQGCETTYAHVPSLGSTVQVFTCLCRKGEHLDSDTDVITNPQLEAWLSRFFVITGKKDDCVVKPNTLQHAVAYARCQKKEVTAFLLAKKGISSSQRWNSQLHKNQAVFLGLHFATYPVVPCADGLSDNDGTRSESELFGATTDHSVAEECGSESSNGGSTGSQSSGTSGNVQHASKDAASVHWRRRGYRSRYNVSPGSCVLWCATNPTRPGRGYTPKCTAKVKVTQLQPGAWVSTVVHEHGSGCWHHDNPGDYDVYGSWLREGVREMVEAAHFDDSQAPNAIAKRVQGAGHLKGWTRKKLRRHISEHLKNARFKRFGGGTQVTVGQLETILADLPTAPEGQESDSLLLIGKRLDPHMCLVFSTPAWLHNLRLQELEGKATWVWTDGTGKVIWQKCRILLLGVLTTAHTISPVALAIARTEKAEAYGFLLSSTKVAVESLHPGWTWDLKYLMSDGDKGIIAAARLIWALITWLQCYYHVQRNLKRELGKGPRKGLSQEVKDEVDSAFRTLHVSWSKEVFEAGWQALQVKYVDTPMYLEHARAEYIDQRENWYVGSSPVGIPSGTPAESAAKMLKDVTNHKLTTLPQFIQNELPKLPKIWGSGCEGFSGRAPQPEPWMWQEAQAILHSKRFYDAGEALFIHQGSTTKKRGRAGMRVREYPPITADEVAQWQTCSEKISEGSPVLWDDFVAFLRIQRVTSTSCTCGHYHVLEVCEGILLWLLVKGMATPPPMYDWKYVSCRPFKFGRQRRKVVYRVHGPSELGAHSDGEEEDEEPTDDDAKEVEDGDMDEDLHLTPLTRSAEKELQSGRKTWHSLHLYRPPFQCGECNRAVFLWCKFCQGCGWCLTSVNCPGRGHTRSATDQWVLHKWAAEKGAAASLPRVQISTPTPTPTSTADETCASSPTCAPHLVVRTKMGQGRSKSKQPSKPTPAPLPQHPPSVSSTSVDGCPLCPTTLPADAKACIFCGKTLLCRGCEGNACPTCIPTEPKPTPAPITPPRPPSASSTSVDGGLPTTKPKQLPVTTHPTYCASPPEPRGVSTRSGKKKKIA